MSEGADPGAGVWLTIYPDQGSYLWSGGLVRGPPKHQDIPLEGTTSLRIVAMADPAAATGQCPAVRAALGNVALR